MDKGLITLILFQFRTVSLSDQQLQASLLQVGQSCQEEVVQLVCAELALSVINKRHLVGQESKKDLKNRMRAFLTTCSPLL